MQVICPAPKLSLFEIFLLNWSFICISKKNTLRSSLDGCMFSTTLNPKFLISHIQFVPGARTIIIVCDEKQTNKQKFFRGKIFGNQLKLDIYSNEKHIKRALCFEFLNEHQNISSSIILFGELFFFYQTQTIRIWISE